jgi:putative flippase GtrA
MALHVQAIRYAVVGIASNFALYVMYLALTAFGAGHKSAMSGLYLLGMLQTFIFNKRWTFAYQGSSSPSLLRYAVGYGFGYLLNLAMLHVLVDQFGFPHQIIQGLAIVVVAVTLFLLQRYWIFAHDVKILAPHCPERIQ